MSKVKTVAMPSTGIKEVSVLSIYLQAEPLLSKYSECGFGCIDHAQLFALGCSVFILASRLWGKYRNA